MKIEYGLKSDIGRIREINEDAGAVAPPDATLHFAVVCDGMGGHLAGEIAADISVRTVVESMARDDASDMLRLRRAIEIANARVYRHATSNEGCFGMGTTMVMAALDENAAYVANVGDSRAYHFCKKNNALKQISVDHSLVEELLSAGQITEKEAETFPFKNIITRAIGSAEEVKADLFEVAWEPGDMILLCSDGLNRHLSDEEIRRKLLESSSVQEICDDLVESANMAGGRDNTTVAIARYLAAEGGGAL